MSQTNPDDVYWVERTTLDGVLEKRYGFFEERRQAEALAFAALRRHPDSVICVAPGRRPLRARTMKGPS